MEFNVQSAKSNDPVQGKTIYEVLIIPIRVWKHSETVAKVLYMQVPQCSLVLEDE